MSEEYIKENIIKDKSNEEKELELIISVLKAKRDLNMSHKNFEYAEEGLIDYYTYQIKLDYLMKKARKKGIALDMVNEIYIKNNKAQ